MGQASVLDQLVKCLNQRDCEEGVIDIAGRMPIRIDDIRFCPFERFATCCSFVVARSRGKTMVLPTVELYPWVSVTFTGE